MMEVTKSAFVATKDLIWQLERELAASESRLSSLKVVHHFSPGIYAREMHIPAGIMLTGATHKDAHLCSLNAGSLSICSEGGGWIHLEAGQTFLSHPGAKRVGVSHTDVIFTTYHPNPTDERDVSKLESMLIIAGADQDLSGILPHSKQEAIE